VKLRLLAETFDRRPQPLTAAALAISADAGESQTPEAMREK
jgi:hypothetical protein